MMAASLPALQPHGVLHLPKPGLGLPQTSPGLRAWPKLGKHHLVLAAVAAGCHGRTLARTGRAGHRNRALVAKTKGFGQVLEDANVRVKVREDGNVQVPAGTHFLWNFARAIRGKTFKKGEKIQSKMFTQLGVPNLQLSLYPAGDSKALDGMMSLYLSAPEGSQFTYKATLGDIMKVSEMKPFEGSSWGWHHDFAPSGGNSIEIAVQILEVIPPKAFVWNFAKDMQSELFDKGDKILSPKFAHMGVPDLQVSLYPQGHRDAPEGKLSLFLRAPEGWQLTYKATLGKVCKVRKMHIFAHGHSSGWNDFAPIRGSPTEVAVEVLEAIPPKFFAWNFGEAIQGQSIVKGVEIKSAKFTQLGVPDLQVSLYPKGNVSASEGKMSLYLCAPEGWRIKYQATLGDVTQVLEHTFRGETTSGWHDFAPVCDSPTKVTVELLQAIPPQFFAWNFGEAIQGKTFEKGEQIKSKRFHQLGVPNLQLGLYPQGHASASVGQVSLFLNAPDGWRISYKAVFGDVTQVLQLQTFRHGVGVGWRDFAAIEGCPSKVAVELLEAIPPRHITWNFAPKIEGKTFEKGDSIFSINFAMAGVPDLQLQLYPEGTTKASTGFMSVFLYAPDGWQIKYKVTLGNVKRVLGLETFDAGEGRPRGCWGWPDFGPIENSSTDLLVQVLEAIPPG